MIGHTSTWQSRSKVDTCRRGYYGKRFIVDQVSTF